MLGLAVWPSIAAAQTVLAGRVTGNGQPLANAEISIDAPDLRTRSTVGGTYHFVVANAASVQVAVRAVGFYPTSRRVSLAANDTTVVDFTLAAVPQSLDSITVEARAVSVSAKMHGFEERRRMGIGRFYTRESLAQRENTIPSTVLRLANLQLVPRPAACGGGYAVATSRGAATDGQSPQCGGGRLRSACYATIFLDGVLYWGPGWGPPPDIDQLKITDLEGMEVYRSALEAPLQYQASRSPCGVLLLWTRVGGR